MCFCVCAVKNSWNVTIRFSTPWFNFFPPFDRVLSEVCSIRRYLFFWFCYRSYWILFSQQINRYWHIQLLLIFILRAYTFHWLSFAFSLSHRFFYVDFNGIFFLLHEQKKQKQNVTKNWWTVFHRFERFRILIARRLLIFLYCEWVSQLWVSLSLSLSPPLCVCVCMSVLAWFT